MLGKPPDTNSYLSYLTGPVNVNPTHESSKNIQYWKYKIEKHTIKII